MLFYKGSIKIDRDLLRHWLWQIKPFSPGQAWVDILLGANFASRKIEWKGKILEIKRGQFLTSRLTLSHRWGWDRKRVSRFLNKLGHDHMVDPLPVPNGVLLTISNYNKRQKFLPRIAHGLPTDSPLNNKEYIYKEKDIVFFSFIDVSLWESFEDHRKEIKKPLTKNAVKLILADLAKWKREGYDPNEALRQTIKNRWQGVFKPKNKIQEARNPPTTELPKHVSEELTPEQQRENLKRIREIAEKATKRKDVR